MKKKTVILLAVLILAAVCLFNSVYTVEENEYGCTVRLSKIISTTDEPGLHFKVPFLDSVKSFPKATMLYDIPPSEVLTADKQNMTVDCYVLWSVSDPPRKRRRMTDEKENRDPLGRAYTGGCVPL